MANTKISALPASTTPLAGTEVLPIVQSSNTKQVSVANLTAGRAVATGALTVTGAATVSTTLGVTGAATLSSTLGVTGATTLSSTLAVTGTSTLTGAVTATAGVTGPITSSSVAITGGSITGITDLAVADGGTGASTAANALNNLLPSQTGNANKYLQTDGTNASWDAVSLSTADITGTLGVANGGTGVTTSTGTTNVVLSNSPTLVTPVLGVATATSLQGIIGNVTPAAGSFTTLGASSTATLNTLASSGATLTGGTINGMTVGATTATTGAFTSVTASTTLGVTGVATFSAGTLLLPAITTTGDTNTGIFFPAADSVATTVGGVEGTRLTSTGLGIGTSSPASKLHVYGGGETTLTLGNSVTGDYCFLNALGKPAAADGYTIFDVQAYSSLVSSAVKVGSYGFSKEGSGTDNKAYFALTTHNGTSLGERLRINSAGTVKTFSTISVGDATPSSSGAGITFPATQSASSNANTLDDYEEGTWTPAQGSGLTVVGAFSSNGTYVKVGNVVTVRFQLEGATSIATGSAGTEITSNLPFSAGGVYASGTFTGTSNIGFTVFNTYNSAAYSPGSITGNSQLVFSITYITS